MSNQEPQQFTQFDLQLQELALTNFTAFCNITGVDKTQAAVCLKKKSGKTFGQISQELGKPSSTVKSIYKRKCRN